MVNDDERTEHAMNTTHLGDLTVSAVGLGTMTFGAEADEAAAHKTLDAYAERGGRFVDTADVYTAGASEEIIGGWLRRRACADVVLATKGRYGVEGQGEPSAAPAYLSTALEASLRRLGVEQVDLYQVHGPDRATPLAQTARFLAETLASGKARYVGVSNFPGWQVHALASLVDDPRFVTHQIQYNLLARQVEWEVLPATEDAGLATLAWAPMASGWLTGKYRKGRIPAAGTRLGDDPRRGVEAWDKRANDTTWAVLDVLDELAARLGRSVAATALGWLLA